MNVQENMLKSLIEQIDLNNQINYCILMSNIICNSNINPNDKQIMLLLLQNRDKNYIRINHNDRVYENIKAYLNLLRPLKIPLNKLIRIGGDGDGGYVMYDALIVADYMRGGGGISDAKALSLGISNYSPWDLEMAKMGFKVIQYDGSIAKSPDEHHNITFYKKFIGLSDDEIYVTLETAIRQNEFKIDENNIMQCDIEGSEYEMLENADMENLSKYFTQVIFEFHGLNPEESQEVQRRTKIMQKLNQYYVPIHIHFNNHGKIFYSKNLFFSTTIEVSYLRIDRAEQYKIYRTSAGNLKNLDYPTFTSNPDIPISFDFIKGK